MITLKDIAKKLDVSVSTVSKALHDSPEISLETTSRIKKVAQFYNYQPNKIALSLKQNKTKTIGVIVPDILNRFFAKVLYGIEKEAAKNGYQIITCFSNELQSKEEESIQLLANGSVDGLIIAVSEETLMNKNFDHLKYLKKTKIPFVLFDRVIKQLECDKVSIDDHEAALLATQKLIDHKRNQIAFISTISNLNVGKLREQGYKDALVKMSNGRGFQDLIFRLKDNDKLQSNICKILKKNRLINGIVAADNISGIIAINVANSLGYKVPEDIAVIGFSDSSNAQLALPKLSYINQHASQIGETSMHLIIKRLNGYSQDYTHKKIPISLDYGESI